MVQEVTIPPDVPVDKMCPHPKEVSTSPTRLIQTISDFVLNIILWVTSVPLLLILTCLWLTSRVWTALRHGSKLTQIKGHEAGLLCGDTDRNRVISASWAIMDGQLSQSTLDFYISRMSKFMITDDSLPFRSVPVTVLGYAYWSPVEVVMTNHIRMTVNKYHTYTEVLQQLSQLVNCEFSTDKPMWEFVFIPMVNKYCVLVRLHHCLGDAVFMQDLFLKYLSDRPMDTPDILSRQLPAWKRVVIQCIALFNAPLQATYRLSYGLRHTWNLPELTGQKILHKGESIPVDVVRYIKRHSSTRFSDVILCCASSAIHQHFKSTIRVGVPVAFKSGDGQNNFALMSLPVTDSKDTMQRLRDVSDWSTRLSQSTDLYTFGWIGLLCGTLVPVPMLRPFIRFTDNSAAICYFPGPRQPLVMHGAGASEVSLISPHHGRSGVSVNMFSYTDRVHVGVYGDTSVVKSPEDLKGIAQECVRAIHELASVLEYH